MVVFSLNHVRLLQSHGLQPARFLWPWDFLSKNTGVSCHFLIQRIFPIQASNCCLLPLSHHGSPEYWILVYAVSMHMCMNLRTFYKDYRIELVYLKNWYGTFALGRELWKKKCHCFKSPILSYFIKAALGNKHRFCYLEVWCCCNKYLKLWERLWNWVVGRDRKLLKLII